MILKTKAPGVAYFVFTLPLHRNIARISPAFFFDVDNLRNFLITPAVPDFLQRHPL